jgi:hypothetical protein
MTLANCENLRLWLNILFLSWSEGTIPSAASSLDGKLDVLPPYQFNSLQGEIVVTFGSSHSVVCQMDLKKLRGQIAYYGEDKSC